MPVVTILQDSKSEHNSNSLTNLNYIPNDISAAYRDPDVIMRIFRVMRGNGSAEAVAIAWAEFDAIVESTDPAVITARLEATRRLAMMDAAELRANGAA